MGSKKNKVKKIFAPSTPPNPNNAVDVDVDLVEDLFAELDSREQSVQQQQQQPASPSAFVQTAAAALDKMSSKSRFMARQVCVPHRDRSELVTEKAYPKARKVAALAEQQLPTDADADAKLEREAKEEERAIHKICNELGLDMHEVSVPPLPASFLINENADQPGRPLSVLRRRGPAGAPQPPPAARGALRLRAPRRRRIHARAPGGLCAFPAARRGRGRRWRLRRIIGRHRPARVCALLRDHTRYGCVGRRAGDPRAQPRVCGDHTCRAGRPAARGRA